MEEPATFDHPHHHAHESRDVNIRGVAIFGGVLVFVGILLHFLLVGLVNVFATERTGPVGLARPLSDILSQSSEPQLQAAPAKDLARMRSAEDEALSEYRWINKQRKIVRIPIDRAIELLAQRGLPARQEAPRADQKDQPPDRSTR